jgi:hypothetical protein
VGKAPYEESNMTGNLFVAIHKTEYGETAYLFRNPTQELLPEGEALAEILINQGVKVDFIEERGDELHAVYVRNPGGS